MDKNKIEIVSSNLSIKIALNIIKQGLSTLLSRISGLTRDILTAYYLGAGNISDTFFASFRIPNSMRKLIGEGPLSASFVPILITQMIKNKRNARQFAGFVLILIAGISALVATILFTFMPSFLSTIVPGMTANKESFDMAVKLSRISIPFMSMTCIVAVLGGITNASQSFFSFGVTPLILNLSMITCMLTIGKFMPNRAFGLSIGIIVGGLIQIIFMLYSCKRINMFPILQFTRDKKITNPTKTLFKRLTPIIFGQGIFQINMFVDGMFASLTPKTQSYLYYSDRLSQFAITIIGHTLGMVSLPMITKYIKEGNKTEALNVQRKCIFWSIIWSIPAAFSLFCLAHPIIEMIYHRGSFIMEDVFYVGNMLKISCIAIPIMAINRIYYSSIYALEKVKIAVISGIIAVIVNISLNLILMNKVTHYYVAISTVVSSFVEFFILWYALKYRFNFLNIGKKEITSLLVVLPVSLLIGILSSVMFNSICFGKIINIIIVTPLSVLLYASILSLFKIIKIKDILGCIKRRKC